MKWIHSSVKKSKTDLRFSSQMHQLLPFCIKMSAHIHESEMSAPLQCSDEVGRRISHANNIYIVRASGFIKE